MMGNAGRKCEGDVSCFQKGSDTIGILPADNRVEDASIEVFGALDRAVAEGRRWIAAEN